MDGSAGHPSGAVGPLGREMPARTALRRILSGRPDRSPEIYRHFPLAHVLAAASPFLQETPLSGIELDLAARVSLRNDGTEYCV
jgi:hypothetical protein